MESLVAVVASISSLRYGRSRLVITGKMMADSAAVTTSAPELRELSSQLLRPISAVAIKSVSGAIREVLPANERRHE